MSGSSRTAVKAAADIPLDQLRQHPGNPRKITKVRLEQLQRTLTAERDMLTARPLIALPDGTVIAGNQRLAAARELGWATIPVVYADLDQETAERWMLLDNRPAGEDDVEMLAVLLREMGARGADIDLAGYLPQDADAILRAAQPVSRRDPDDAPALPGEARSVRGQVYELGPHRVMCGDATSEADVAALVAGERPRLCVTDPPYGVNYDPAWRSRAAEEGHDRADWSEAWALFPGDVIYSWHPAGATSLVHAAALQDSGFELRMQIIWAKSNFPISRGDYHVRHEPCWYAIRKGASAKRTNDRTQTTLWEINLDKNVEGGHSTQKPVECMARPIRNHEPSDVYDPFCGSGTTLIACEMLDRRCFAMELDPGYCDVIRQRYADYTNQPQYAP